MTAPLHPAFRFATEAQWNACEFTGADRSSAEARKGLRPFAPFGLPRAPLWEGPAFAPAFSDSQELVWRDDAGGLWRFLFGDEQATRLAAPAALACAKRLVATVDVLWVLDGEGSVVALDSDGLAQLFAVDLGRAAAIDIAGDSRDGLYILAENDGRFVIVHVGCSGRRDWSQSLDSIFNATELVYLGTAHQFVVLASRRTKLCFIDANSGQLVRTILLATLRGCFTVTAIGSDHCARMFIAGRDRGGGGGDYVLVVDQAGGLLAVIPVAAPVSGIAASRTLLYLATSNGMLQFKPSAVVPQGVGDVTAKLLTPELTTSAKGPQKWIRADATVRLPPGCSIAITCVGGSGRRTTTYHGDPQVEGETVVTAPLQDVQDGSIRVELVLIAAPGGGVPAVYELKVFYPGETLIEHLPAIYRRGELEFGDFTRALVGVLEAGTQDLDLRIAKLGRNIDPSVADPAWLDYVASWLGLPWDNGLAVDQKRRILSRGPAIVRGYSTRAGLEALLECLIPGSPRRFRVTDLSADYGLVTLAEAGTVGSRLPAILAGLPKSTTDLGAQVRLGAARLPCGDPESMTARLIGRIRIDIAATAAERLAWSPWLSWMIDAMLPAMARAELRWLDPAGLQANTIESNSELTDETTAHLGTDSITGSSRLGGRSRTTLPNKLTGNSTLQ